MPKRRKRPPHWYRMISEECPVCGSEKHYRERVIGKRPKDLRKRYVNEVDKLCNCLIGGL